MQGRRQDRILTDDLLQVENMVLINPERPVLLFDIEGPACQDVNGGDEGFLDAKRKWRFDRFQTTRTRQDCSSSQVTLDENAHLRACELDLAGDAGLQVRVALHEIRCDAAQTGMYLTRATGSNRLLEELCNVEYQILIHGKVR